MSVVSTLWVKCKRLSRETPNQSRLSPTTKDVGNRFRMLSQLILHEGCYHTYCISYRVTHFYTMYWYCKVYTNYGGRRYNILAVGMQEINSKWHSTDGCHASCINILFVNMSQKAGCFLRDLLHFLTWCKSCHWRWHTLVGNLSTFSALSTSFIHVPSC